MTQKLLTRRRWLTLLAAIPALSQAQAAADGLALKRPLAVHSVCLDLCLAGKRLVAVGERGHVLLSDDQGKQWRQAATVPTRATLTAVHAVDARQLWAVGHGGVILRSEDAGENWAMVFGKIDGADVLLSIYIGADGLGMAVGGFGLALRTADAGAHWSRTELLPGEDGERHLNHIFLSQRGTWLIAAESGHLLRSEDAGGHWQSVSTPYAGSLWSGLALNDGVLLACGMRGNVLRSSDDGRTWRHLPVLPGAGSLTALAQLPDGRPVIVGVDGCVLTGQPDAERFSLRRLPDRATLTGAVVLASGELVVSTTTGPRIVPAV